MSKKHLDKERLKRELDALPDARVLDEWTRFAYPVEARAAYEVTMRLLESKAGDIKIYGGFCVPAEQLATLIYVPQPVHRLDKKLKERSPNSGIQFLSGEQNVFIDIDSNSKISYGDLVSLFLKLRDKPDQLDRLRNDSSLQQRGVEYSRAMLICSKRQNNWHLKQTNRLIGDKKHKKTTIDKRTFIIIPIFPTLFGKKFIFFILPYI